MKDNLNLHHIISHAAKLAVKNLYGQDVSDNLVQLQKTRKEFEGDITLVVFPLGKISGKGPEQTGEAMGRFLQEHVEDVTAFNVVKGFLNISMSNTFWLRFYEGMLSENQYGFGTPDSMPRVMVEYSSPNTNKPLHLGHLRNIFLGYAVSNILKAYSHAVTKVQIINDRGIHICKSMLAWQKLGNGETPESSGMKGDKLVGKYYVEFDKMHKQQIKELIANGIDRKSVV